MSLYIPDIRSEKPEKRSGHICFGFRGNVFIWGGYNDEDAEDLVYNTYISSESLWIYNVDTCTWKHVSCSGEIPQGLSGACASRIRQTIYLFGGHCAEFGHTNSLYSLDLMTYKWKNHSKSTAGQPLLPRDKFGSWVINDRIIYFGGYGPSPADMHMTQYCIPFTMHEYSRGWNGQIAVLKIHSNDVLEWEYPAVKGEPPQPRAAHGMARIGNTGYLFGGRHSICRDNDLHCLDLENLSWSGRLQVSGPEPCGRSWHVFVTCGPKHILLHGGFDANDKELEDAWLLDVHSLTWIEIDVFNRMRRTTSDTAEVQEPLITRVQKNRQQKESEDRPPRTRLWHTACQTDNEGEIAIFGGCSGLLFETHSHHTNDLVFFHFTPRKLQRLCEDAVIQIKGNQVMQLYTLPKQILRNLKR